MTDPTFQNGSVWLRADFHLHTRKDKEFSYQGADDRFISNYIDKLKQVGISIGVITNHNKFDCGEFKALTEKARRNSIFLLPGVELSVGDGSNGIHTLIVFSDAWIAQDDYINAFLTTAFQGKVPAQYEHENGRTTQGLIDIIKLLESNHKDFFLVFAHVEQQSGLWNEMDGGRLEEFGKSVFFRRRTLGFQKVRTHDKPDVVCRQKVKAWLQNWYPAEVEGCDAKKIEDIGNGKACHLKVGAFSFEAVKFALLDHANRVASVPMTSPQSHIQNIHFEGAGALGGRSIHFSPELNTLIGIRGSGKSSILEAIRYVLEIPFGDKASDQDYKQGLVGHLLSSGGKVTLHAVDQRGQAYEIRRIHGERPDVYVNGQLQPGVSIRETVLHKPIYFGQKDLSSSGEGFEKDLIEKLLGEHLASVRGQIAAQAARVGEAVAQIKRLARSTEQKREWQDKEKDAIFQLGFYQQHGIEEKLQKQVDFDADERKCDQLVSRISSYLGALEELIAQFEDELKNEIIYLSKYNQNYFVEVFTLYQLVLTDFEALKQIDSRGQSSLSAIRQKVAGFKIHKASLKEEFAEIERKLAAELQQSGAQAITPQQFRQLHTTLNQARQTLQVIEQNEQQQKNLRDALLRELATLNDLWLQEYRQIEQALGQINESDSPLQIKPTFKGNKSAMLTYLRDVMRGSNIRMSSFEAVVKEYADFSAIYQNIAKAKTIIGGVSAETFERCFLENLQSLLQWQVPNIFAIEYHGKALKHHSLGQRASALILFVLSQRDNDVVIIDQPEDDLDNQTIYEDVIKLLQQLKPTTQFIFATHNANIPVLGDAEQVLACQYHDNKISVEYGSIDNTTIQQHIVDIMEGGEEAFRQRKKMYELWKPQSY